MSGLTRDPRGNRVVARRDTKPWQVTDCRYCGQTCQRLRMNGPLFDPGLPLTPHACTKELTMPEAVASFLGLGEPLRDRYDRPLIIPAAGGKLEPYTRVSTFAGSLDDAGGLITWKARMTALGIARHEDLAAMCAGLAYGDKELDEHIETAICRVDDKAAWGTAVHSLTEPDPSPYVPERMAADVASYHQALADHELVCVDSERFVVNDTLKVAGTFDGIYTHPTLGRLVGDKKTGKLKGCSVAVQLFCYASAVGYDSDSGERTSLDVRTDVGLLFHIPKGEGRTDVYLVDLVAGERAAKAAAWVREWRKRDDLLTHLNPLTVGDYVAVAS